MEKFLSVWPFYSHKLSPVSMTLQGITSQTERIIKAYGISLKGNVSLSDDLERNLQFSKRELNDIPSIWLNNRKPILNLSNRWEQEMFL